MKKLTKGQRFALAREARRLAMECVEGTAPEFGVGRKFIDGEPCCVVGHLQHRARLPNLVLGLAATADDAWLLFKENDRATKANRHAALVFPLLALADAIDASTASLPEAAP